MEGDNLKWTTDPVTIKRKAIKSVILLGHIVDLLDSKNPEHPLPKNEFLILINELKPVIEHVLQALVVKEEC